MKKAMGYWWPHGAEAYGRRYIAHAEDMQTALRYVRGRRTAVQAGGHVGVWPRWLAGRFAQVITFEPEPANFECLTRNLEGLENVQTYNAGLGAEPGQATLSFNTKNTGGHKLRAAPGADIATSISILPIDALQITDVDLIVLDVEGWEHPAIAGAMDTINHSRPVIMLEDRGHAAQVGQPGIHEIEDLLAPLGYQRRARVSHDWVYAC